MVGTGYVSLTPSPMEREYKNRKQGARDKICTNNKSTNKCASYRTLGKIKLMNHLVKG